MCKLALFPYIKPGKEELTFELAEALTPYLTAYDQDGFGYAALGEAGVFVERWLNPEKAWIDRTSTPTGPFAAALEGGNDYTSYGIATERVFSLMLHARMATAPKGMVNTHPFISDCESTTLVHNGVISNARQLGLKNTTCDSESILLKYISERVTLDHARIDEVTAQLSGYYACGVITTDGDRWFFDIFKDAGAKLHCAYITDLEAYVFVTDPEHIERACEELGFEIASVNPVKHNTFIRVDAQSGEVVAIKEFTPFESRPVADLGSWRDWRDEYSNDHDFSVDESEELRQYDTVKYMTKGRR